MRYLVPLMQEYICTQFPIHLFKKKILTFVKYLFLSPCIQNNGVNQDSAVIDTISFSFWPFWLSR